MPNIIGRLERLPITNYQKKIFAIIATAWLVDQIDVALLVFLLGSVAQYFNLTKVQSGLLAAMTFSGQLVGNILVGFFADKFGRRSMLQITMLLWGSATLLAALSWSITSLMVLRFLVGVGVGGEAPVAQAFLSEIIPAKQRGKYIAYMEGFWAVGYVLAGTFSYFLLPYVNWRGVFVVVGLLAVWVLWLRRLLPESPRWLLSKGRIIAAENTISKMEAETIKRTQQALPEAHMVEEPITKRAHPLELLISKEYLRRNLMLAGLWFFALLGYFGLSSWLALLLENNGFSVIQAVGFATLISVGGIPGFFSAGILLEKIGRKASVILFTTFSAVAAYFYGHSTLTYQLFITGFIMEFFMFGMWSCLYAYTPELYPTSCRSTGAGLASAYGRVGALLGPVLIGYTVSTFGSKNIFTLGAACLITAALFVLVFGIETKGKLLEDASK